jgi:hypothetical protein
MTDAVFLALVEEQHLIAFRHRVVAAHVPHVDAAIRKDQEGRLGAFHRAGVSAAAPAHDVANVRGRGIQVQFDVQFGHELKTIITKSDRQISKEFDSDRTPGSGLLCPSKGTSGEPRSWSIRLR